MFGSKKKSAPEEKTGVASMFRQTQLHNAINSNNSAAVLASRPPPPPEVPNGWYAAFSSLERAIRTDEPKESELAPSRQAILLSAYRERICPIRISRRANYREVRLALSSTSIRIIADAIDILSALDILSAPPSPFTSPVASIEWNPGTAATPCDNCARR